jgi:hypothetical protein
MEFSKSMFKRNIRFGLILGGNFIWLRFVVDYSNFGDINSIEFKEFIEVKGDLLENLS